MGFNHEELEKYSKELFESINDNSIQLDSSHFILFNINSFILFNNNYNTYNDRVMDIMIYLLDYASKKGKINPKEDIDEVLLSDSDSENKSNKARKAIWFVEKIKDKFIKNKDYKIDGDFIKIRDTNKKYVLDCKIPVVLLGLSSYYSRNKSNDYKDYLNKLKDKFDYDFDNSIDYFDDLKKYLKNKKNDICNNLIDDKLLKKINAKLNNYELSHYSKLLHDYEVKNKAEKTERKFLFNNIKKLFKDRIKIGDEKFITISNGLISEASEIMGIKRENYDDIDLVMLYSYLLSSVSDEVLIDYKKLNLQSNDLVFNSESFDNNIIYDCTEFIDTINNFNTISNDDVRLERISNYYLDFNKKLIGTDNSMLDRIENRNQSIVSSIRNSILNGNIQLIDRNKFLLFDNDVYFLGTFNGISDLINKLYYIDDKELTPTECVFSGLKNILDEDLYNGFIDTYEFANEEKKKYEIKPDVKLVNSSNSRVDIFINGLIFTLVIMLVIVGIIGYIII